MEIPKRSFLAARKTEKNQSLIRSLQSPGRLKQNREPGAFMVFSRQGAKAPSERSTGPLNMFLNLLIMDIYHIFVKPKKTQQNKGFVAPNPPLGPKLGSPRRPRPWRLPGPNWPGAINVYRDKRSWPKTKKRPNGQNGPPEPFQDGRARI
jgi:hypothetical protein